MVAPTRALVRTDPAGKGPAGAFRIVPGPERVRPLLGRMLVRRGALAPGDLVRALALQAREEARLGEILLTHGMVAEADLMAVLAEQWGAEVVDLARAPPDSRLIDAVGVARCVALGLAPWRRRGGVTVVATARPEKFAAGRAELEARLGPVAMALATEAEVARALTALRWPALGDRAEARVPEDLSCRRWQGGVGARWVAAGLALFAALALLWPGAVFAALAFWAAATLIPTMAIKGAALICAVRDARQARPGLFASARSGPTIARLPTVSILVPLFREEDVAGRLIRRLERLNYPRELTDILLVCEESDATTARALAGTRLPRWMRVVTVPKGAIRTKPRALNYALDFCRGGIVGVWDAEDAPAPDQLHRIVRRFHERGPEVACLQGVLDYYNARANWLARCFAIEYAAWFRVVLPGLQKLGLAIPLGGTTLFFRRAALEALGGWDAHNVTEDADLGMRLARAGYRTEMVATTTWEEANCRVLPWIKQRSRWLKGYAMTWAVHMRRPVRLWRDLGPRQFMGFQALFLGTLSQFLLTPVYWAMLAPLVGLPHPLQGVLAPGLFWGMLALFLASEVVALTLGLFAVRAADKRFLMPWVPTLHAYFPLASIAAYKALAELLVSPYYWDKTRHGLHDESEAPATDRAA